MSRITYVEGAFQIYPQLMWKDITESEFNCRDLASVRVLGSSENNFRYYTQELVVYRADGIDLDLVVDEEETDTPDGSLVRRTSERLMMREIDGYRADGLVDQVQRIVDMFPGRTFAGRLECRGQENEDMWRVEVQDSTAVEVRPRILWPSDLDSLRAEERQKVLKEVRVQLRGRADAGDVVTQMISGG